MSASVSEMKNAKTGFEPPRESKFIDLLALSGVAGLGDEGIAQVWQKARQEGGGLTSFYNSGTNRLQTHYGLSAASAKYVCQHSDQLRNGAKDLLKRAQDFGIVILAAGDADYPVGIDEFYNGNPPLLYARGNLSLLNSSTVAILNSAGPSSQSLTNTLGLASRLAEAGWTLLAGTENPAYNVVGLAGKRAESNLIIVLHQGMLTTITGNPHREPIPLARHEDKHFDPDRALVISPFRLDGRWQKGNGPRRDRLLVSLAKTIVGIEIKLGGDMEALCRQAIHLQRRVFVSQNGNPVEHHSANDDLIELGGVPFVPDGVGSDCDLILQSHIPAAPAAAPEKNDLERRREIGQFFTPAVVARFMWDFLEIIHGEPFGQAAHVIDPACGDGVFLRIAAEHGGLPVRCLFGVDIDETLIPVWRNDSLLRKARLYRSNGLIDNPTIGVVEGAFDLVAGNPPFSGRGLRDLMKLVHVSVASHRHQELKLFGQNSLNEEPTIADQPLPAHERVVLDHVVRQLSRYSCWRLCINSEDDENDIAETMPDDLFAGFEFSNQRRPAASDYQRMAQIVANWSPDRLLDTSKPDVRETIQRLAGTAIEVFFAERFVRLAKPGGLIAVIVPESIVASDQLGPLRTWLLGQIELLASISLPQKVFTGVGANAKTSIIFARRLVSDKTNDLPTRNATKGAQCPDVERTVLMAALLDADRCSLEDYLSRILEWARKDRGVFRPSSK